MALQVLNIERKFIFESNGKEISVPDVHPDFTPDQVMNFYSGSYPELTTSTISGPEIVDDKAVYRFKTTVGTKA